MAYLFDTDALSEALRPRPLERYITWLGSIDSQEQFTSAVVVAELLKGARRQIQRRPALFSRLQQNVIPLLNVLPFDASTAEIYGSISADLEKIGRPLAHADLQIASTAIQYEMELVTGNIRHFERVPSLRICRVLAEARDL